MLSHKKTLIIYLFLFLLFFPLVGYGATAKTAGATITINQLLKFDAAGKVIPVTAASDIVIGVALNPASTDALVAVETTDDVLVNVEAGVTKGQFLLPSATLAGKAQGSAAFVVGTFAIAETDEGGTGKVKAHFIVAFPTTVSGLSIPHANTTGQTTGDHHAKLHGLDDVTNHSGTLAPTKISPQGSTSTLDADLLDGVDSTGFATSGHGHTHASTTGQTINDHHAKSHLHDGLDGSGTVAHSDTTGRTANDHHTQIHAIDGADHTGSLDDNEIVSSFSGTNHMDTATSVEEALIDLDGAINGVVNYFSGVDVAGGVDVSAGWTDITLDTEHAKSGITHAADSAVVTIDTTGVYVVSYHLTLEDSNNENQGYTGEGRLVLDTGAGFAEVSGTRTAFASFFDPMDATPMGSCSMSIILSLTATDALKLQGQQNQISSDTGILTMADGCGLTIHSL